MKLDIFLFHFIALWLRLLKRGGLASIVAENIALRQQLITVSRRYKRMPNLATTDRVIFGFLAALIKPIRLARVAIIIKPATLLTFHKALVQLKYHRLFTNKTYKKPGPKGPDQQLIHAIIEMKTRNPRYGCRRIAMQLANAFDIDINKDIVRRVLNKHFKNLPDNRGPSWLTFLGHMKDSLWSIDLFRVESIHLKSHWDMVILDQHTRRIIGFESTKGDINSIILCRMFNKIIAQQHLPNYLSSDHDPLYTFHRWQANLRILEIEEIKSIPYTPISHLFVEQLIGIIRQEFLDHFLFWNQNDLQKKLESFQDYYNHERCHSGINGISPKQKSNEKSSEAIFFNKFQWKSHCRGLFQLPTAA